MERIRNEKVITKQLLRAREHSRKGLKPLRPGDINHVGKKLV